MKGEVRSSVYLIKNILSSCTDDICIAHVDTANDRCVILSGKFGAYYVDNTGVRICVKQGYQILGAQLSDEVVTLSTEPNIASIRSKMLLLCGVDVIIHNNTFYGILSVNSTAEKIEIPLCKFCNSFANDVLLADDIKFGNKLVFIVDDYFEVPSMNCGMVLHNCTIDIGNCSDEIKKDWRRLVYMLRTLGVGVLLKG